MIWITHLVFAALIFLFMRAPLNISWFALPLCLFAALFPDIDHQNSKISNKLTITSRLMTLFFNHRGIIHSLVAAIAFSVLLFFALETIGLSAGYTISFAVGYISHLLIDSLNPYGVAWLDPFSKKRASGFVKTGGVGEILILLALSAVTCYKFFNILV